MIYEPNTVHWEIGALVIHDCDAKRSDMLMRVVGFTDDGLCRTEYLDAELQKTWGKGNRSRLLNPMHVLHDPRRFGLVLASAVPVKVG